LNGSKVVLKGTGLVLAIVKMIINPHDGNVGIENSPEGAKECLLGDCGKITIR
jgi:nitrogen fixation/metabolism regulation signal transduction histidine kinase